MADLMPQNFPTPTEQAIASYDYFEFTEGTGVVIFHGGAVKDTSGTAYVLDRNVFYPFYSFESDSVNATGTHTRGESTTPNSDQKLIELDFNLSPFNTPRIISGKMTAILPIGYYFDTANQNGNLWAVIEVIRYDGSSEHSIVTATSADMLVRRTSSSEFNSEGVLAFSFDVPQESFEIGDNLRITVGIYVNVNATIGVVLGHDPVDREVADNGGASQSDRAKITETSDMKFLVPFRIQT